MAGTLLVGTKWDDVELYGSNNDGQKIRFEIADGVAVSKGDVLALRDDRNVVPAVVADTVFAGIAAEEVLGSDNPGAIAVWTQGRFLATASEAIGLGAPVTGTHGNFVLAAGGAGGASGATVMGYSDDVCTDNNEVISVRLNL